MAKFEIDRKLFEEILKEIRMSGRFYKEDFVYTCSGVVEESGISLKGLNRNASAMIEIKIPKTTFTKYAVELPAHFVFDKLDTLESRLDFFKQLKKVIIYLTDKELMLCDDNENNCFSLNLSDNDFEKINGLCYTDAMKLPFNLKAFKTFIKGIKKSDNEKYVTIETESNTKKLIITHKDSKLIQNISEINSNYKNYFGDALLDAVRNLKADECYLLLKADYPIGIEVEDEAYSIHLDVAPFLHDS